MHQIEIVRNVPVQIGNDDTKFATAGEWKTVEEGEEIIQESCFFLADDEQVVYEVSYWREMNEECIFSAFDWSPDGPVLQEVWHIKDGKQEKIND